MTTPDCWKRKLMAFLHDPPEKAYDFSEAHEHAADGYMQTFGLDPGAWRRLKDADWASSAADRLPFPKADACTEKQKTFKHPLTGHDLFVEGDFPSHEQAAKWIGDVVPSFKEAADYESAFWLVWRLWFQYAAEHERGRDLGADRLVYLPADTRIPDHTIWHHLAVASALETTRAPNGKLKPAFLLFQLGPVQDFIAQARSTRDLWSGSYLISWLMAHALQFVAGQVGPHAVIYPALRAQPLYDWLNQEKLKLAKYGHSGSFWDHLRQRDFQSLVLTPCLPHRLLAVVPADFDASKVESAVREEWEAIAETCLTWLGEKGCSIPHRDRWQFQVDHFLEITWQIWSWPETVEKTRALFLRIPAADENRIRLRRQIDDLVRQHGGHAPNLGNVWSENYQLGQHRHDARRQTRNFDAWNGVPRAVKDDYSGREEEVIDEQWRTTAKETSELKYLFRKDDEHLGAPNLIKRIWHKAYLAEKKGLPRATEAFDSVMAVAAEPWKRRVLGRLNESHEAWAALLEFQKIVRENAEHLGLRVPKTDAEGQWFEKADAEIFYETFWNEQKNTKGLQALRKLTKNAHVGKPPAYYAVLALDGDHIGKWVAGECTPPVGDLLSPAAVEYFKGLGQDGQAWLASRRPLSPAYHLQLSEALSNFALYCARRIVEHHGGQLIYTGGDDVRAMLPAEEAIPCARGLRLAFQGDPLLAKTYPELFAETHPGMVQLKDNDSCKDARRRHEPYWPLLVMGAKTTVSVGLAIGHIREPLQDMVEAAHEAEKDAKAKEKGGRDALAVKLFKRSGEIVEWHTKFVSEPFDLLAFLNRGDTYRPPLGDPNKPMPISAKFPHRICELLRRYEGGDKSFDWRPVAEAEVNWAISRLRDSPVREELREKVHRWLQEAVSLQQFYNLFAVEAFIARPGEA